MEHTERDADEVAEELFGSPLFYDDEDVQTTDQSAPGARHPRPAYLDGPDGRTLDSAEPMSEDGPDAPRGTMQLNTVEDVVSALDDAAAQGDAKTPRLIASQLSQQAKQVGGAQSRTLLTLAKAARHCATGVEARLDGQIDRAMTSERMCDAALQEAAMPRSRMGRENPEWAKKLGSGLYKGARYSAETAHDLYQGARAAHAARSEASAAREPERKNPHARAHARAQAHPGFEQYEFRVENSFMPALINGDTSGLDADDIDALDRFLAKMPKDRGSHWAVIEDDAGFGPGAITRLGSDRSLVALMVPKKARGGAGDHRSMAPGFYSSLRPKARRN
jgi:hypothetical protein